MKKIFTLIAAAFLAVSANAQTITLPKTWNFSDFDTATYTDEETIDGLSINAAEGKAIAIDANTKTIEEVEYTKRLKFGGTGSATSRNISFTVSGAADIQIALTSSSSTEDHKLAVAANGTQLKEVVAPGGSIAVETINYTGSSSATITIYSTQSGVNLYFVKVTEGTASGDQGGDEPSGNALIDYPTSMNGITIGGTTTIEDTQRYHGNTDTPAHISFANGYTTNGVINDNYAILTVEGGFKTGDKITIAGYYNNSATKNSAVDIFIGEKNGTATRLWQSAMFINGRTDASDPVSQSYTLEADYPSLKIGRADGLTNSTRTNVILIKVERTTTGINDVKIVEPAESAATNGAIFNLAGQKVNESYKGVVISNGKKMIQK